MVAPLNAPVLEVHNNTYVTREEADELVNSLYLSNSPEFEVWFGDTTPDGDKIRALISSATALNNLKYKGGKARKGQKLAFPRKDTTGYGQFPILFRSQLYDNTLIDSFGDSNGLESAKKAQVANAIAMLTLDPNIKRDVTERLVTGIKARKMQSVSEDYGGSEKRTSALMQGLYAKDLVEYHLNSWLVKGVISL